MGRAGRSGDECIAVLYFNNSDLGRQGVSKSVGKYCRNDVMCRKNFLDSYFGYDATDTGFACKKCDVCNTDLKCSWQFKEPLMLDKKGVVRNAICSDIKTNNHYRITC